MNSRSILIIEDDMGIQAVTKFSLEMDGHWQVTIANCGREGLLKAKIINPDVILLDAIALNTREVEILSQLRLDKTTRNIPIILFTTKIIDLKHLARQNRSIIGTIYKPFDALTLSKKICDILTNTSRVDENTVTLTVFNYLGISRDYKRLHYFGYGCAYLASIFFNMSGLFWIKHN